jgi:hypothetical protein
LIQELAQGVNQGIDVASKKTTQESRSEQQTVTYHVRDRYKPSIAIEEALTSEEIHRTEAIDARRDPPKQ